MNKILTILYNTQKHTAYHNQELTLSNLLWLAWNLIARVRNVYAVKPPCVMGKASMFCLAGHFCGRWELRGINISPLSPKAIFSITPLQQPTTRFSLVH
jgi:hypothetical protein